MMATRVVQITIKGDADNYATEIERMIEKNNEFTKALKETEIIQLQKEIIEHNHTVMELLERVRVLKNEVAEISKVKA